MQAAFEEAIISIFILSSNYQEPITDLSEIGSFLYSNNKERNKY